MQIVYFPYLPLKDNQEIKVGNVVVWHFYSLAEKYIPDDKTRSFIHRLIETNVQGENNEKVKGVSIVSIGPTDFRIFSTTEEQEVQEVKLLLFLSKIAKTNTTILGSGADGWTLSTTENFEPVYQNFEWGNDHISETAGYIVNIGSMGYRLHEKKFHKPSHVIVSPFGLSLDEELLVELPRVRKKNGKRLFRRIMRATDLLSQAYYNTANVSRNARVLLQASAFETLLNLDYPPRKYFKEFLERYCDIPGEKKHRHYYRDHGRAHRDRDRSIKVLWGNAFFELRNQIIHGDIITEEKYQFRNGDRHFDIAILFFCLLVKKLINNKFGRLKPFLDTIEWKTRNDGTAGFHYEDRSANVALARLFRQAYKKRGR